MILYGLRYITDDLSRLETMTLVEYGLLKKAKELNKLEGRKQAIELEFIKRALKVTERKGDKEYYKIKDIKDIFDFERAERQILGVENKEDEVFDRLKIIAQRVKEFKKGGEKYEL